MKNLIRILFTTSALALLTTGNLNAATHVYDLKADWSDTQNPNGTWSYRLGNAFLLSNNPFPWARFGNGWEGFSRQAVSLS